MLTRFIRTLIVGISFFRPTKKSGLPPRVVMRRPVWDNGTNYDIPTYLRRSAV
jgi:hypothetical protein